MSKMYAGTLNVYNTVKGSLESAQATCKSGAAALNGFPSSNEYASMIRSYSEKFSKTASTIYGIEENIRNIDKNLNVLVEEGTAKVRECDEVIITENNDISF